MRAKAETLAPLDVIPCFSRLEKDEKNSSEAAKHLRGLFDGFGRSGREQRLNEELQSLVAALRADGGGRRQIGEADAFLVSVFDRLPVETRQKILTDSAAKALEAGQVCLYAKRLLLAFER